MKKRTLAMRFLSMALAAVMTVGLSATAFAADGDPYEGDKGTIGGIADGATEATGGGAYPEGMSSGQLNNSDVTQYVDKDWVLTTTGVTGTAEDKTTITVSGIVDPDGNHEDGVAVKAYRIVEPVYFTADDNVGASRVGQFKGWAQAVTADGVTLVDTATMSTINENFTRENLGKIAMNVTGEGVTMTSEGKNGTYSAEVGPGAWLVLVSGSETVTYGPMVVSSYYTNSGMAAGTLGLVKNRAFAKRQDEPSIEKDISGMQSNNGAGADVFENEAIANNGVVSVGDEVWYDILVKNLPEYHGTKAKFVVTDTISPNLKIDTSSLKYTVMFSGSADTKPEYSTNAPVDGDYPFAGNYASVDMSGKVTVDNTTTANTLVLDFCTDGVYHLNEYAGFDMVIRYKAVVVKNDGFEFDENGVAIMGNTAKLDFTHNSTVDGDDDSDESETPNLYTFKLAMTKIDGSTGLSADMDGAKFELRPAMKDNGDGTYSATDNWDEAIPFYGAVQGEGDDATDALIITSGEDGVMVVEGLAPGKYLLKEVEANGDYSLNETVYTIDIVAVGDGAEGSVDWQVTGLAIKLDGANAENIQIPNIKMTDLPSTGGAGTALLIGVGLIGALLGCIVIFGTRKKQED